MIYDTIDRLSFYVSYFPWLEPVKEFLAREDLPDLQNGRFEIDGDRVYASIDSYYTKGVDISHFEAHRRYIDFQVLIGGRHQALVKGKETFEDCGDSELCGVASPASALVVTTPYDEEKDILFGQASKAGWINLTKEHFAVFFPNDAHLPGCHPLGRLLPPVRKCVVKIRI